MTGKLLALTIGCAVVLAACGTGETNRLRPILLTTAASTQSDNIEAPGTASFDEELLSFNSGRWSAANWSNEGMFVNAWSPSQLYFVGGRLMIHLEADLSGLTGKPAVSGEYRSKDKFQHGWYTARFKASNHPGTVSAFFTYTGPGDGTRHDEIDVEVKGDDPTRIQVNYWTDGVEHPTVIDLGFDASLAEHEFGFNWTTTAIRWYVDGALVHEETGSRGSLPSHAQRIMLSHWGVAGASPWSSDYVASAVPSVMTVDRVSHAPESAAATAALTTPMGSDGALPVTPIRQTATNPSRAARAVAQECHNDNVPGVDQPRQRRAALEGQEG